MILIGRAAVADAAALAALHASSFPDAWSSADMVRWLALETTVAMTAEDGDRALGFALAQAVSGEAEILTLAVHPQARRKGVGRSLLDRLSTALASQGVTKLYLDVAADNAAAIALYRKADFVEMAVRQGYYARGDAPPVDAVVMSKVLELPVER